jgi:hypothetical protein
MAIPAPTRSTASRFCKYSSLRPEQLDWLKVIILKHELYFPNLSQLNDPADGRPKLAPNTADQLVSFSYSDLLRRKPGLSRDSQEEEQATIQFSVQRSGKDLQAWLEKNGTESIQRMMAQSLYAELDDYRVYSLSKRWDNLGMWAKYAANHSGYCLEFANEGPFASACDVTYGEYLLDLTDLEQRSNPFLFFCKSKDWSNEEEARILLLRGSNAVVRIEPRWLTRLILGENTSDDHRQLIRQWAKLREPELAVVSAYYDELHQVLRLRT